MLSLHLFGGGTLLEVETVRSDLRYWAAARAPRGVPRVSVAARMVTRAVSLRTQDQLMRDGCTRCSRACSTARGHRAPAATSTMPSRADPPPRCSTPAAPRRLLATRSPRAKRLMIVADYDCDGATACAVGVRALAAFGANVSYLVPNRFEYGYGLTPEIVALARARSADLIITVDNGIASVEGVDAANQLGIAVLVTDQSPSGVEAAARRGDRQSEPAGLRFPSKSLAGVASCST